jgi:organic radical activating enzyme
MRKKIARLDLTIVYSCNISCKGCISLSDIKREGIEDFENIKSWVDYWSTIIDPEVLTIFGGEPCLHNKLLDICSLVRDRWPNAIIRLITNGYLLDRFPPDSWFNFMPFEIQVSLHRLDHKEIINAQIEKILKTTRNWKVIINDDTNHHKQISWKLKNSEFEIYKSIFKDFVVPFKENFLPWFSSPEKAHQICGSPNTPILYKGKLYKCPPVANIIDVTKENKLNYSPCSTEEEIDNFISYIGKPEHVCSYCPERHQANIVNHFDPKNVNVKKKNIS